MSNTGTDIRVQEAKEVFYSKWGIPAKTLYISENLYRYLLSDLQVHMIVGEAEKRLCFGMYVVIVKQDDHIGIAP